MAHRSPRRLILVALAVAVSALAGPSLAQRASVTPTPLSDADQALVAQASDYLNGLGEVKGRFVQTDARGGVSQGQLFIQRPGKARFEYDPPSSQLVISDGSRVSVADPRLRTFNSYPLGSTPLSLFLSRDVRLDRRVQVVGVVRFADGFSLTARDVRHPNAGTVTLAFASEPMRLRRWTLADAQGRTTTLDITRLDRTSGLDPALFVPHDPRPADDDTNSQ